jgi:acyl-CoA synthetase (AMP-forming)/AMP-acid ligase II
VSAPHYSDLWQGIARSAPDRLAIVTRDDTVTWGRLAREAGALSRHLRERSGLSAGDAAAMLLYNRPEYLAFMWACLAVGVAPVALNYRYTAVEVRALLQDSDARVLLTSTSFAEVAVAAVEGLGIEILVVDDGGSELADATRYADVVAAGGDMPDAAPRGADLRLYTGGTTGAPKAVVWDLDTLLEARRQSTWGIIDVPPPATLEEAVAIALDADTPRVVTLPMSPLLHGTAQSAAMATLALGGTIVLHARASMDIAEVYRLLITYEVTRIVVAGDVLALPLAQAAEGGGGLPHVRWIISSGMRFSDDVKRRLHRLGDLTIIDMLASSEGGPFAFGITRSPDDLPAKLALTPGTVLLDEDFREVSLAPGALGILGYRGILPRGYYGDPAKTARTFLEIRGHRYVVPGDWARARGDGTVELLGRLSAVVNTGGEKVFPAEVEEVLLTHPDIADAVVFGLPDPRFGEVVCASVVPFAGREVDVPAVLAFVGERLAGFKKPRHVVVRDSLDRSATGKVELAQVKDDARRALDAEAAR